MIKTRLLHWLGMLSALCFTAPPTIKERTCKAERQARYKELQRKAFGGAPAVIELKIIRSEYLPAGTMVVAPDVYAMFQQVSEKQS